MIQALTTTAPLQLWDAAVSRYLETRKGGPEGNTAKTYGRTLKAYKDFALESGLSTWAGDAIIAYNELQNGLRKVNGGDLANDPVAARLGHISRNRASVRHRDVIGSPTRRGVNRQRGAGSLGLSS
jgi:hypothetical protein